MSDTSLESWKHIRFVVGRCIYSTLTSPFHTRNRAFVSTEYNLNRLLIHWPYSYGGVLSNQKVSEMIFPKNLFNLNFLTHWYRSHGILRPTSEALASLGRPGCWRWYGSQTSARMNLVWPVIALPNALPLFEFQTRTVLSLLPVAIRLSSGDQLTANTQEVWPFSVWYGVPVSVSHILAVLSLRNHRVSKIWSTNWTRDCPQKETATYPLPVTMREEFLGENCVANIASPWPDMLKAERVTTRTLNTAWGARTSFNSPSVFIFPGTTRVL